MQYVLVPGGRVTRGEVTPEAIKAAAIMGERMKNMEEWHLLFLGMGIDVFAASRGGSEQREAMK